MEGVILWYVLKQGRITSDFICNSIRKEGCPAGMTCFITRSDFSFTNTVPFSTLSNKNCNTFCDCVSDSNVRSTYFVNGNNNYIVLCKRILIS